MTDFAPRDASFRRDIASAYVAAAARIGSWVVVSALVYRYLGAADFGILALVRGTLGILNYVTLGLSPALIHRSAAAVQPRPVIPASDGPRSSLAYQSPRQAPASLNELYDNALALALMAGLVGLGATFVYALTFTRLYPLTRGVGADLPGVVACFGGGIVLRLVGDAPGAILQVRSRIALDNLLVSSGDLAWALLVGIVLAFRSPNAFLLVAGTYAVSGLIPLAGRLKIAMREAGSARLRLENLSWPIMKLLLSYGSFVVLAQLADYLYAPTDYILIARLLHTSDLAGYAPAVQIDAGLLLLVTGLSAVLLPKTALAHAAGSSRVVRAYYVRGTLASLAMLAVAATSVWAASPWILRLWLGNPMPATQAILPLVLLNTVLGGSSAVGRSVLLAVGKVRPFTIAALASGAVNVGCSFAFVRYLHMGLKGIVLGTVVAVAGRCVIWMPWYVLRAVRNADRLEPIETSPVVPEL